MLRWLGLLVLIVLLVGVVSSQASQFALEADAPSTYSVRPTINVPPLPAEEDEEESDRQGVNIGVLDDPVVPEDPLVEPDDTGADATDSTDTDDSSGDSDHSGSDETESDNPSQVEPTQDDDGEPSLSTTEDTIVEDRDAPETP